MLTRWLLEELCATVQLAAPATAKELLDHDATQRAEVESLRTQLAKKDAEIERLQNAIDELRRALVVVGHKPVANGCPECMFLYRTETAATAQRVARDGEG